MKNLDKYNTNITYKNIISYLQTQDKVVSNLYKYLIPASELHLEADEKLEGVPCNEDDNICLCFNNLSFAYQLQEDNSFYEFCLDVKSGKITTTCYHNSTYEEVSETNETATNFYNWLKRNNLLAYYQLKLAHTNAKIQIKIANGKKRYTKSRRKLKCEVLDLTNTANAYKLKITALMQANKQ